MHSPLLSVQGTVGCIGLLLIGALLVYLFWRKRRIGNALDAFYATHKLTPVDALPAGVLAELGNGKWYCWTGSITAASGNAISFHWWEGERSSVEALGDGGSGTHISHYLAISFAPGSVSKDFVAKVQEVTKTQAESTGALKKFFVYDTTNPYRVETLSDGSFLIAWQSLRRADIYEEKIRFVRKVLNTLPMKKEVPLARIPYTEIINSAPTDSQECVRMLMRVLDSMNRDYHDTKAHPTMTLEDHTEFFELDEEQARFVKDSIKLATITGATLRKAGFYLPEADGTSEAAIVTFPHCKMTYLIPQDIYIDMNQPGKVYVYR